MRRCRRNIWRTYRILCARTSSWYDRTHESYPLTSASHIWLTYWQMLIDYSKPSSSSVTSTMTGNSNFSCQIFCLPLDFWKTYFQNEIFKSILMESRFCDGKISSVREISHIWWTLYTFHFIFNELSSFIPFSFLLFYYNIVLRYSHSRSALLSIRLSAMGIHPHPLNFECIRWIVSFIAFFFCSILSICRWSVLPCWINYVSGLRCNWFDSCVDLVVIVFNDRIANPLYWHSALL